MLPLQLILPMESEFIIMDAQKKLKKLTLWEEFVALYENTLTEKLNQYPVILAKRVAKSSAGLSNRYNTSILIHPTYPQATTLHEWAQLIQPFLIEYTAKSTSKTGSLLLIPFEEESTCISDIQMQPPGQIFCIDGQLTITNQDQHFCFMACSDCKTPFTRSFSSRPIYCIDCDRSTMLIPRLQFDITATDHTSSAIAFVSDEIAEKMLDLSIKKVYDICQAKEQSLLFEQLCTRLGTKAYKIQMKKLFSKNRDTLVAKLALLNYEEKQNATQSAAMITVETTKRKVPDINDRSSGSKLKTKKD